MFCAFERLAIACAAHNYKSFVFRFFMLDEGSCNWLIFDFIGPGLVSFRIARLKSIQSSEFRDCRRGRSRNQINTPN